MEDVVIEAAGVGKKFRIGSRGESEAYSTLRDMLARQGQAWVRRAGNLFRGNSVPAGDVVDDFWALRGVGFEMRRGDVLGIIGHNGAGKSTLLKILSRITEPTEGRVEIEGRVSSLLEVGTGFHPELTGRENCFLNGAILGMSRREVRRKFDQIVDFASMEKFIDTPVKRYSTGMYVRLAFAVAAHLESEILIIDEVLAVGDAEFQARCLGRISDVAKGGRTVLFVSHNLAAISALTQRAIVFERGKTVFDGETNRAIDQYARRRRGEDREWGRGKDATIVSANLLGANGEPTDQYVAGTPIRLRVLVETYGAPGLSFETLLRDERKMPVAFFSLGHFSQQALPTRAGRYECDVIFEPHHLAVGSYSFDVFTTLPHFYDDHYVSDAVEFSVLTCSPEGTSHNFHQMRGYGNHAFKLARPVQFGALD